MPAYHKVEVSLNANAVEVGVPEAQTVNVVLPLVGPAGATGPAGAAGASAWNDITGKPATFPPSAHDHQPGEVYADAAFVSQTGGSGRGGIYLRNGSDNGKPLYESPATGDYIWWDSNIDTWYLTSRPGVNLFEITDNTDDFPWETDALWQPIAPQTGNVEVDQASLFDVSDYSSTSVVGLKTPKSGNASSDELVLGSDTRLTNSRTPTAHASTHHTGGTDAIAPNNISAAWALETRAHSFFTASTYTLAQGRNVQLNATVSANNITGTITLPRLTTDGAVNGDELSIVGVSVGINSSLVIQRYIWTGSSYIGSTETVVTSTTAGAWRFRLIDSVWTLQPVANHASTHHTGGSDPLTPANIGAAPAVTEIEVPNNGTSTTTLTTGQLPARVIIFVDANAAPSATINLPTPGVRQSGLLASIKVQIESGSAASALVTVVHDATTLLNGYELDEDESSIDFLWDGYAWTYSSTSRLRSYPNRVLQLPSTSGTIARTEDFASPPAIGNTTPAAGSFTTLNATGTTELVNGASAAGPFFMYRSFTNTSNYERGFFRWTGGGVLQMGTERLGGSGNIDFELTRMGLNWVQLLASGMHVNTVLRVNQNSPIFMNGGHIGMAGTTGAAPLEVHRDDADTLAQRRTTNAQTFRLYGTYTTATNYQRMAVRSVKTTLSALSGASVATTGTFIPDGAVVVGVTTQVTTAITGATGYQVGDGTDADRWGDINAFALNTTSDNRDWTAGTIECFTAGGEVTLTANGPNFTAGAVEICVFYLAGEAD